MNVTFSIEVSDCDTDHIFERTESLPFTPFPGMVFLFCDCCDYDQFTAEAVAWDVESSLLSCALKKIEWDDNAGKSASAKEHFIRTGWK